jgi:hypothetical protein
VELSIVSFCNLTVREAVKRLGLSERAEELPAGHPLAKPQFGLGIGLVSAPAPQAKGRIERLRGPYRMV